MFNNKKKEPPKKRRPKRNAPKENAPKPRQKPRPSQDDTMARQKELFSELAKDPELFEQVYENSLEVDNTNLKKSFQTMLRKNKAKRKQKEND